jgi:SPP1 gp7 family putative phage head morphogenesis protein
MRRLTRDSNIYEIRDKLVRVYLRRILRRFKRLNQSLLAFDEVNNLYAVNACYEDVIMLTVDCLKEVTKRTRKWLNGDDDFLFDAWLMGWLNEPDPVTHYKYFDEADRKRSRLFEAIESCRTSAERKKQIEIATQYFAKQFEQTADDVVNALLLQTLKDNEVKYVRWVTMHDAKVCADCASKDGKIYPINSPLLRPVHYNCRCWWIPAK